MKLKFSEIINLNSLSPQTEFEEKVVSFLEDWFSDSEMVSVQTSGSTGKPKIFEVEKHRMLNSAKMTCDFLKLKKGNSALLCLPVEYISGKMMLVRSIERGLKLSVVNPTSAPMEFFSEEIDFCAMSPLQVENSLDKIHLIKNLIIGGAQVSATLKEKLTQKCKNSNAQTKIYETYGMSETLSHIALKQIYPIAEDYFTVLKDVEIALDERGCLVISAPKLNPQPLKTNDLVELKDLDFPQSDKKQFKFLGRFDNVINSGGLKIHPEELGKLVNNQISNEVVFLGINDQKLGQKLVLLIEGNESDEIKNQLSAIIYPSKNHKPKKVVFKKEFPRLPNGKIDRLKLLNSLIK